MRKLILIGLLLTNCGVGHFAVECDPIGTGKWTIEQDDVTCERIQQEVNIALDILEERGFAKRTDFVNSKVEAYQVTCLKMGIMSREKFDCYGGIEGQGNIKLDWSRTALLHELLHVKQESEFDFSTVDHKNWDTNGFYDADNEFIHKSYLLWYNEGKGPVMEDGRRQYYNQDGGSLGIH